jgi:Domain of unknown function (DUF4396)
MAHPAWLHIIAWVAIGVAVGCAMLMVIDVLRRPQKMAIMNFVWPITALYWGPAAVWAYVRVGMKTTKVRRRIAIRSMGKEELQRAKEQLKSQPPTRAQVALSGCHCGAGCTLGDLVGEWWLFAMPLTFAGGDFTTKLLIEFLLAWAFGVVFQYFTIAPMRGISGVKGVMAAIKADTVSIVAFQIGMSVWMALTYYVFFPSPHLRPNEAVFWFMMQIAMIVGYFTSYPANIWLLEKGLKERMPDVARAAYEFDQTPRRAA